VGVDECEGLIVGHHDVDGCAVLAAVQASVLPHRPLRGCGP